MVKAEVDRRHARPREQCGERAPVGGETTTEHGRKTKRENEGTCEALSAAAHPARVELVAFPKLAVPSAAAMELEPVPSAMAHFNASGIPPRFPCVPLASEQPLLSIDKLVLDSYAQALLDDTLRLCAAARVGAPALPLADDGLFDDVTPTETQHLGFEIFQMLIDEPCAELPADGENAMPFAADATLGALGTNWGTAEVAVAQQGRQGPEGSPALFGSADLLILNNDGLAATARPLFLVQGGSDVVQGTAQDAVSTQLQCEQPHNVTGALPANPVRAAGNGSERIVRSEASARHRGSLGGLKHSKARSESAAGLIVQMGEGPDDMSGRQAIPPTSLAMSAEQSSGRETLCLSRFSPGLDSNENRNGRDSATRLKMRRISEARAWGELAPGSPKTLSPRVGDLGVSKSRLLRPVPPPPLDNFLSGASVLMKSSTHLAPRMPTPELVYEELEPRRFRSAPLVHAEPLDVPSSQNTMRVRPPDISAGPHDVPSTCDGGTTHPGAIASEYAPEEAAGSDGNRTTSVLSLSIPTAVPKSAQRRRAR